MVGPNHSSLITQDEFEKLQCTRGKMSFARRAADESAPAGVTPKGFSIPLVNYEVTVRDARPIVNKLSLDREGFVLVQHKANSVTEPDPEIMTRNYLDEMKSFIKDYFNATWVAGVDVGGVTLRSVDPDSAPRAWG